MDPRRVFNPDDYLQTPQGRVYTDEDNAAAWEQIYSELEALFSRATPDTRFFIVMGVQGSGKSTWIRRNLVSLGTSAVCLDAALPARRHRMRALALAKGFHVRTVGVWINVPLERALAQNARRPSDQAVPEFAVRSVFDMLEPPSIEEGFHEVIEVTELEPGGVD
jgi:predicted kinase